MKKIILPTGRLFSWKLYWWLLALNVPAAFALIPFAMNLQKAYADLGTEMVQGVEALVIDRIVTIILIALLALAGLRHGLPHLLGHGESHPHAHASAGKTARCLGGILHGIGRLELGIFLKVAHNAHAAPLVQGFLHSWGKRNVLD